MSQQPDLDDPELDGDPGLDADPGADHAAHDEWAAVAGEPVPREAAPFEERTGPVVASFDAIAATLTETQAGAAAHPGSRASCLSMHAYAGDGALRRRRRRNGMSPGSTLTAAVAHRVAVDGIPPHRVLAVTFTNKAASEMANRIRAALGPDSAPYWLGTFPPPRGPSASRFFRSRVLAGELRHPRRRRRPPQTFPISTVWGGVDHKAAVGGMGRTRRVNGCVQIDEHLTGRDASDEADNSPEGHLSGTVSRAVSPLIVPDLRE